MLYPIPISGGPGLATAGFGCPFNTAGGGVGHGGGTGSSGPLGKAPGTDAGEGEGEGTGFLLGRCTPWASISKPGGHCGGTGFFLGSGPLPERRLSPCGRTVSSSRSSDNSAFSKLCGTFWPAPMARLRPSVGVYVSVIYVVFPGGKQKH